MTKSTYNVGDKLEIVSTVVEADITGTILELVGMPADYAVENDALTEFEVGDVVEITSIDEDGHAVFDYEYKNEDRQYTIYSNDAYDNRHCFELVDKQ